MKTIDPFSSSNIVVSCAQYRLPKMTSTKDVIPYADEPRGTILENITILNDILSSFYNRLDIIDIANGIFLDNERREIEEPSTLHLLAIKKILLYAIPVISSTTRGITLTSRVNTPAIRYNHKVTKSCSLAIGDKFELIGFAFPSGSLISHLDISVFPLKYVRKIPDTVHIHSPIDLSHIDVIESKRTKHGLLHLIKSSHYENVDLYNLINRYITERLSEEWSVALSLRQPIKAVPFHDQKKLEPFNKTTTVSRLNKVLMKRVDPTFTMSLYETLISTSIPNLYDHIHLLGFESPEVNESLKQLVYIKDQTIRVLSNELLLQQQQLLSTRSEKLAKQIFPHYFDYTHRDSKFVRFNRFSMQKLNKEERGRIEVLLQKDLAEQDALLNNKCEHLSTLVRLNESDDQFMNSFESIQKYIDYDSPIQDGMLNCKLCKYSLVCLHTVTLYDIIKSSPSHSDSYDAVFNAKQQIINKFKLTNQLRTGKEDTEVNFTFYCKHCSADIGKSSDIIQAGIGTMDVSSVQSVTPMENDIYTGVFNAIKLYTNHSLLPVNLKTITKLIFGEVHSDITSLAQRSNDQTNLETVIRYLSYVYALAGVVSINNTKMKIDNLLINPSSKSNDLRSVQVVDGGDQLKDNLKIAFNIIRSIDAFKIIKITNDNIKSMLLIAFKTITKSMSVDIKEFVTSSPSDRLRMDIISSPISIYASHMRYNRNEKVFDPLKASGVELSLVYPKGKKAQPLETNALYTNVFKAISKAKDDRDKYINESYESVLQSVSVEPKHGKYDSRVTEELSDFSKQFEHRINNELQLKRMIPYRFLPVENSREYNFELQNVHMSYCLPTNDVGINTHRWIASKKGNNTIYTCKHCSVNLSDTKQSNNDVLENALIEQMILDSFFELYTIACPIKDVHVFENEKCIQCNVTNSQIAQQDIKYFKRYKSVYQKRKDYITKQIIDESSTLAVLSNDVIKRQTNQDIKSNVDMVKLESLALSLSKMYEYPEMKMLGMIEDNPIRSLEAVQSYVRLFYSHYLFVKNLKNGITSHPDSSFFTFIKDTFFKGVERDKTIKLKSLPDYPDSRNADQLLYEFFTIVYDIAKQGDSNVNQLIKFLMNKIVTQSERKKKYDFSKLKSIQSDFNESMLVELSNIENEEDEDEFDMFNGYDISGDDIDDNIDGDLD